MLFSSKSAGLNVTAVVAELEVKTFGEFVEPELLDLVNPPSPPDFVPLPVVPPAGELDGLDDPSVPFNPLREFSTFPSKIEVFVSKPVGTSTPPPAPPFLLPFPLLPPFPPSATNV